MPQFENLNETPATGKPLEDKATIAVLWKAQRPFRLMYYTMRRMGCRPREILQWEWDMISWNEPGHSWIEIPARITMTNRARRIPLNPDVSRILYRRFSRGVGSPFVFPSRINPAKPQLSYQSAWVTASGLAKVDAMVLDLRRAFIAQCAKKGHPAALVSELLEANLKYVETFYDETEAEALERLVKDDRRSARNSRKPPVPKQPQP